MDSTKPRLNERSKQEAVEVAQVVGVDLDELGIAADARADDLVRVLIENERWTDALAAAANALPTRYAVLWASDCLRNRPAAEQERLAETDPAALRCARDWVDAPDEPHRQAAAAAAEADGYSTPGGWVAAAAGWSGGSMTDPEFEPVPPPPGLAAKAIVACLMIAAASAPAEQVVERQRSYLDLLASAVAVDFDR